MTAETSYRAIEVDGDYGVLTRSFRRGLLAGNKSSNTVSTYLIMLTVFGRFLAARGMPTTVASITREHVEEFLADQAARFKPNTVGARYRALSVFFRWCLDEGEIRETPMARVKPPIMPEQPPAILAADDLKRLLKACDGRDFDARRDAAMIRLLLDTGMRRGELLGLKVADLDFDQDVALVMGKGRRPRAVPFGQRTAVALDRYLRERSRHKHAASGVGDGRRRPADHRRVDPAPLGPGHTGRRGRSQSRGPDR